VDRPLRFESAEATKAKLDAGVSVGDPLIDLSRLRFVDPYGLVSLARLAAHNIAVAGECTIKGPEDWQIANYLARMKFDTVTRNLNCGWTTDLDAVKARDRSDVLVELRPFYDSAQVEELCSLVWHRLEPVATPQTLDAIYTGLGEIGDNVRQHSGARHGFVAAQVYDQGHPWERVEFAIADAGVGIRAALARHSPRSDAHAIDLAVTAMVSGIDDPGRGQGLSTTKELTLGLRGRLDICTGTARKSFFSNGNAATATMASMRGTTVFVSVPCSPGST
jgi:hypothetical protein